MDIKTRNGLTILTDPVSTAVRTRIFFLALGTVFVVGPALFGTNPGGVVMAALVGAALVVLAFYIGRTRVVLDPRRREIRIIRASFLGRTRERYGFDQVEDVQMERGDAEDFASLRLRSGEKVVLSRYGLTGAASRNLVTSVRSALRLPQA